MSELSIYKKQVSKLLFGTGLVKESEFQKEADNNFSRALSDLIENNEAIKVQIEDRIYLTKIINPITVNEDPKITELKNVIKSEAKYYHIKLEEDQKKVLLFNKDYNLLPIKKPEQTQNYLEYSEDIEKIYEEELEEL